MKYNEAININNINKRTESRLRNLLGSPTSLVNEEKLSGGTAERVMDVLMNPVIRRGDGVLVSEAEEQYLEKMSAFIQKSEPIQIVFQGFAFKCHNPVETLRQSPDLGELATIKRVIDINETVKRIYPPGLHFTALTEGKSYMKLFGADANEVELYKSRCEEFARLLDAGGLIGLIDFMDLVPDEKRFFEESRNEERYVNPVDVEQFTPVMMRSMPIIERVTFEDLFSIFGYSKDKGLTEFQKEFARYLRFGAKDLAIKYLAIQRVKKKQNIINNHFPGHLYFSTTAKHDRYSFHPIHRKTRLYAHHGVPVLGSDKVDIVYLGEILSNPDIYTAVYIDKDTENAPFYFLKGRQFIKK